MAITENELVISNKSYTNKDFESIYTETLDMARKISTLYDPANSTEADPFVVLLKLTAFVADKINYNVDKNILERFLVSCTQRQSMQEVLDMLGYNMAYYKSATTTVNFQYKKFGDVTNPITIRIPAGSIVTTNSSDQNIQYVTLDEIVLASSNGWIASSRVIEGEKRQLSVLGSTTIQLENLDINHRIYFPESYVAQNDILIEGGSGFSATGWKQVDNLNTQSNGSPVFIFRFDSKKNLPYIEFPYWINSIIGSGISITYFTSQGSNGNVAARTLTVLKSEPVVSDGTATVDDIYLYNPSSSSNGANPESLDESYEGYKKVVGTFDTLVTCRDYANRIYELLNDNEMNYVSNVQVSDRRTDLNDTTQLMTYTANGFQYVTKPRSSSATMNGNDIRFYCMSPIRSTSWSSITKSGGYNDSYTPANYNTYVNIEADIDEEKTISHNVIIPKSGDIFSLRNNLNLDGVIITNQKVNTLEQLEILKNINTALSEKYNARTVDYGYELSFDDIVSTIESADSRIKSISLQEPQVNTSVIKITNSDQSYSETQLLNTSDTSAFKFIVAQNLYSGRVAAFEWDSRFSFNYNQSGSQIYEDSRSIQTNANVKFVWDSANQRQKYVLRPNEAVQFLSPSYTNDGPIYPYGILYHLVLNQATGTSIPADSDYKLQAGEYLKLRYQDDNDYYQNITIGANEIIHTALELSTTASLLANNRTPTQTYENEEYFTLSTKDEVCKRKLRDSNLISDKKMYWIRNNSDNTLFAANESSIMLGDNEYLFISDMLLSDYVVYGSGTTISRTGFTDHWYNDKIVDILEIEENGLDVLADIFQTFKFTSTNKLTIQENQIITLTEGDAIYVNEGTSSTNLTINNNTFADWTSYAANTSYQMANSTEIIQLPIKVTQDNISWKARGLLDVNAGPDSAQHVCNADSSTFSGSAQTVTITYGSGLSTVTLDGGSAASAKEFKFDKLTQLSGGGSLKYTTIDLTTGKTIDTYPSTATYTVDTSSSIPVLSSSRDEYAATVNSSASKYINVYKYGTGASNKDQYFMIYVSALTDGKSVTLTPKKSGGSTVSQSIEVFSTSGSASSSVTINSGMYVIKLRGSAGNIVEKVEITTNQDTDVALRLSPIKVAKQENPLLGLSKVNLNIQNIFNYMKSNVFDSNHFKNWYMCATLEESRKIELSEDITLAEPQALYDFNNIANKWVIPKISFDNCNIRVAYSSKK